jgi:hypothetical protein
MSATGALAEGQVRLLAFPFDPRCCRQLVQRSALAGPSSDEFEHRSDEFADDVYHSISLSPFANIYKWSVSYSPLPEPAPPLANVRDWGATAIRAGGSRNGSYRALGFQNLPVRNRPNSGRAACRSKCWSVAATAAGKAMQVQLSRYMHQPLRRFITDPLPKTAPRRRVL